MKEPESSSIESPGNNAAATIPIGFFRMLKGFDPKREALDGFLRRRSGGRMRWENRRHDSLRRYCALLVYPGDPAPQLPPGSVVILDCSREPGKATSMLLALDDGSFMLCHHPERPEPERWMVPVAEIKLKLHN